MTTSQTQQIAARFFPRIQKIARGIARHLPSYVDAEDLTQAGVVGMISALDSYDSTRCDRLEVYVERRVRGAILDELRALDPLSRDQRKDARAMQAATRAFEAENSRTPNEEEVASRTGLTLDRVRNVRERSMAITPDSLDERYGDTMADMSVADPLDMLSMAETRDRLVTALTQLSDRQRVLLSLYYLEELSLKEIGQLMGVTESRVCQIHGEAVKKLRAQLLDA
jgi:RNA polymerase sigma factor for flagellar operon FliA